MDNIIEKDVPAHSVIYAGFKHGLVLNYDVVTLVDIYSDRTFIWTKGQLIETTKLKPVKENA